MILSADEKSIIKKTTKAMKEVRNGHPLKDFMDIEDVEKALALLVRMSRDISAESK